MAYLQPRKDERSVGSAEPKRIRECSINRHITRGMRYVVEITIVARVIEINSRRSNLVTQCQSTDSSFNGPSRTQEMADHGFSRANGNLRVGPKDRLD